MSIHITLPEHIYKIYNIFEKFNDPNNDNLFKLYKNINNIPVLIAKNISNLNYYIIDIPFSNKINPNYILQYLKNKDYRNHFSPDSISFKFLSRKNDNEWKEEEIYLGSKTIFDIITFKFQMLFYNSVDNSDTNTSQAKYYNAYKILKHNDKYILRFEIVLNNLDIDQDIDLTIYLSMIINILKATYNKLKIIFDIDKPILELKPKSPSHSNLNKNKFSDLNKQTQTELDFKVIDEIIQNSKNKN